MKHSIPCSLSHTKVLDRTILEDLLDTHKEDKKYLFRLSEEVINCEDCLRRYQDIVQKIVVGIIRKTRDRTLGFKALREYVDKNLLNLGYDRLI